MSLEHQLHEALHAVDQYEPSPDLFARVTRSLVEDRRHRIRVAMTLSSTIAGIFLVVLLVASNVITGVRGTPLVERWVFELVETVVLLGMTFALGPSIRRFGRNYVDDIFRSGGGTGGHVIRLMDLAFYLVFVGLTLQSATLSGLGAPETLASGLQDALLRTASFLLTMGVLHAMSLAALPLTGLVFTSVVWKARRRESGTTAPPSPGARQAERAATWALIALAVIGLVAVTVVVPSLVFGVLGD